MVMGPRRPPDRLAHAGRQGNSNTEKIIFEAAFPPPPFQNFHHALGARLHEQGHAEGAESDYRRDLGNRLLGSRNNEEGTTVERGQDVVLAFADVPVAAFCFRTLTAVCLIPNGSIYPKMVELRQWIRFSIMVRDGGRYKVPWVMFRYLNRQLSKIRACMVYSSH
ncbi:hypothetical protein LY76DRAFT_674117 [Colletotrichum caudatum]|nr:hypothetical protein LY76DRAFT_674117 [Colletotrichum caudatum]